MAKDYVPNLCKHGFIQKSQQFWGFPDGPSDMYTSVSEDDSSSEYSVDSKDVNIRPTKWQKTLETDYDLKS